MLARMPLLLVIAVLAMPAAAGRALGGTVEGFLEPYRKVDLAPTEPGLIAELPAKEGDRVSVGQIVAKCEYELLSINREIAKSNAESHGRLDGATAEVELRRARLAKLEELSSRGHATTEEVDRARSDVTMAEAGLLAEQERRAIDRLELKKTEKMIERRILRSPIDGVVSRVYKEEKEFVPSNSPTILTVVQLDPLRVIFSVPTHQAIEFKVGQTVPLMISETGSAIRGKIELVSPVTDAESGTVRVKVLLDNRRGTLRCGVRCAWELDGRSPVSRQPEVAVP